jgi:hypothetical protein
LVSFIGRFGGLVVLAWGKGFTLRIHYDILEFKQRIQVKSEVNLAIALARQTNAIKVARGIRPFRDNRSALARICPRARGIVVELYA